MNADDYLARRTHNRPFGWVGIRPINDGPSDPADLPDYLAAIDIRSLHQCWVALVVELVILPEPPVLIISKSLAVVAERLREELNARSPNRTN